MSTATRPSPSTHPQTAVEVRDELVRALRLDVIGPDACRYPDDASYAEERLPVSPSRWYLAGFLVPFEAGIEQRTDETSQEEVALAGDEDDAGADENVDVDSASAPKAFFPSSLGLSVLVSAHVTELRVDVTWGDYRPEGTEETNGGAEETPVGNGEPPNDSAAEKPGRAWVRSPRRETLAIAVPSTEKAVWTPVPNAGGSNSWRQRGK